MMLRSVSKQTSVMDKLDKQTAIKVGRELDKANKDVLDELETAGRVGTVDASKLIQPDIDLQKGRESANAEKTTITDPEYIFKEVWSNLVKKYGEENLSFPRDIMWLSGAPGAGKGIMTPLLQKYRGLTSKPLEVSSLFVSPEAQRIKAEGKLIGDKQVVELLMEALLNPEYQTGVLVDGFPRTTIFAYVFPRTTFLSSCSPVSNSALLCTRIQAECIKLLYDKMMELARKYSSTDLYQKFRRPMFHITVLYIDKEESIKRQLHRGAVAKHHNDIVLATGVGQLKIIRETDIDSSLADERYQQFRNSVYESLKSVKEKFHFHFINAEGTPQEVTERIINELRYQSSMELADDTFEMIRRVAVASEITMHARQDLVSRLDNYRARHGTLFERVITVLQKDFMHIIKRQALSGRAIIRSDNPVLREPLAIDMLLDVLSERGFIPVLDVKKEYIPRKINSQSGEIECQELRLFEFQIDFPRPTIRRG